MGNHGRVSQRLAPRTLREVLILHEQRKISGVPSLRYWRHLKFYGSRQGYCPNES
jgi:hypothetical protein